MKHILSHWSVCSECYQSVRHYSLLPLRFNMYSFWKVATSSPKVWASGYLLGLLSMRSLPTPGMFFVQTRITFVAAPINALANYMLVWGPEPVRLGFIGAPIATAISFNLISLMSILYGIYFAPRHAWHPISRKMFTNLGLVTRLGLAGIGKDGYIFSIFLIVKVFYRTICI